MRLVAYATSHSRCGPLALDRRRRTRYLIVT
jgi:hypothetical protein